LALTAVVAAVCCTLLLLPADDAVRLIRGIEIVVMQLQYRMKGDAQSALVKKEGRQLPTAKSQGDQKASPTLQSFEDEVNRNVI
jgi:hypothetical protein